MYGCNLIIIQDSRKLLSMSAIFCENQTNSKQNSGNLGDGGNESAVRCDDIIYE